MYINPLYLYLHMYIRFRGSDATKLIEFACIPPTNDTARIIFENFVLISFASDSDGTIVRARRGLGIRSAR